MEGRCIRDKDKACTAQAILGLDPGPRGAYVGGGAAEGGVGWESVGMNQARCNICP